jgi:hypothetical protein
MDKKKPRKGKQGVGKYLQLKWEGKLEFEKSCQGRFANKITMFEEMLEIKQAISLCYERQKTLSLYEQILKAQMWAFIETSIPIWVHVLVEAQVDVPIDGSVFESEDEKLTF